ncbi:hypothetical protein PsorP6_002983 [Peronosclerospora sorghi]|uniref:Uncharacterized protein n=1 Tax=Peronosclerospora sorghi TaxID=230839 RepID=A0ACC0VN00_9STRA|nr:hypothetical protein PsorP6_002983 [Peronosclerospora sorghi]
MPIMGTDLLKEWEHLLETNKFRSRTVFEKMWLLIKGNPDFKLRLEDYFYMAVGSEFLESQARDTSLRVPVLPSLPFNAMDPVAKLQELHKKAFETINKKEPSSARDPVLVAKRMKLPKDTAETSNKKNEE